MKLPHPLLLLLLLFAWSQPAFAVGPWFERGKPAAPSPFRWRIADAKPGKAKAQTQAQEGKQAPRKGGHVAEGGVCGTDDDCVVGTYCDKGTCVKVTYPFHIPPYLFYRSFDGRFTEVLGIYWYQGGTTGYQVFFPFYWHFWSPDDRSRAVLPFYYNYRHPEKKISSTFYTLFQYRRTPNEKNYRLWPIFFWTDYGERGSGLSIMPIFHFAREGTRRAAVLPFLLSGFDRDPERGYSRGLLLGIYYWHREKEKGYRADAVLPFFYHSKGKKEQTSFTWVLPFNFHWRKKHDSTLLLLPFFYQGKTKERTTTVSLIPPLYHRREGQSSRLFALPFFYHSRDGDRSFFVGGPVYYASRAKGHSFGVFPLLFTRKGPLTGYRVVFPVFWQFYSRYHNFTLAGPFFHWRRGTKTTAALVPLFYYGTRDHGRRSFVVSPLFLYERDDEAKVKHWGLLAPPFYSRRDPDRKVDALIPLGMRWYNKVDRSTTWVVGPTVFYNDPEGGTQVFFPFFWRFADARTGAATSILFPFGYRHRRPDSTHTNLFFPFYYRKDRDGWAASVLPLLYFRRSTKRSHAVLFPAFWYVRNPKATTTVLGPAYYRRTRGGWHTGVFPVLYAGSDSGEKYGVVFPALWYLKSKKEGYTTYIAGTGFYSHGRKGRVFGLLPVFAAGTWKGTHFQTVLPPLFYRSATPAEGRSYTVAGPYIGWHNRKGTGHAVVPLAYYHKSASGKEKTAFTVPLFYYRSKPAGKLLVSPLGGFRTRSKEQISEGIVGPYVWHRSPATRGFAILPVFYRWHRTKHNATTTVVFPLGVHHRSDNKQALVWFPFFWRYVDQEDRALVVFPLYWRLRQRHALAETGIDADVVFPLFWSFRRPKKQLHVVGPMFWARSNEHISTGLVPLFLYRRNPEGTTFFGLPFAYYRRNAETKVRTWVVGPFYHRRYEKGSATGVLPLFYRKDTPDSRYTIVAPLYWDWGSPKKGTRTIVAGPFVYRRKPDKKAFGVAPIFYRAWERTGATSTAFLPLFYQRSEPARFALYTPLAGYDRSPERTQWYVGNYFRRRGLKSSIDLLFPLFLRHRNNIQGRTTVIAPAYFGRWSKERSFHLLFPFLWRHRRIDSSATVVFPVLWDFNDRYSNRTTILFPALLYHRDHKAKSTSVVTPPALWLRFRPEGTDAWLFPIVWHWSGHKDGATVVAPLWWDFRYSPNKRRSVFFPLFWDWRNPDKTRHTLLLPLLYRYDGPHKRKWWVLNTWYTRDKRDDTYGLYVFPLFVSERKRPGDFKLRVLLGLFGYERIGRNRMVTLGFYTFPIKPLPPKGGAQDKQRPPRKTRSGPKRSNKGKRKK